MVFGVFLIVVKSVYNQSTLHASTFNASTFKEPSVQTDSHAGRGAEQQIQDVQPIRQGHKPPGKHHGAYTDTQHTITSVIGHPNPNKSPKNKIIKC